MSLSEDLMKLTNELLEDIEFGSNGFWIQKINNNILSGAPMQESKTPIKYISYPINGKEVIPYSLEQISLKILTNNLSIKKGDLIETFDNLRLSVEYIELTRLADVHINLICYCKKV
jgi:hypothetical protein